MSSIIIVLPKLEDAKHIKDILARRGLTAAALCTTASMALSQVHQLDSGVVICSYRIRDMHYTQLAEYLPDYFDMLYVGTGKCAARYGDIDISDSSKRSCQYCGDDAGTAGQTVKEAQKPAEKENGTGTELY